MASCMAWHQPLSSTVDSTMRAMRTLALGGAASLAKASSRAAAAKSVFRMSRAPGVVEKSAVL
jgi:hypothetical protein